MAPFDPSAFGISGTTNVGGDGSLTDGGDGSLIPDGSNDNSQQQQEATSVPVLDPQATDTVAGTAADAAPTPTSTTDDSFTTSTSTVPDATPTTTSSTTDPSTLTSTSTPQPTLTPSSTLITSIPSAVASSALPSSDAPARKGGASSAAIGVTVTIFIILACAASFFLVRRRYAKARRERRNTWNRPPSSKVDAAFRTDHLADLESTEAIQRSSYGGVDFQDIDIDEKYGPTALNDPMEIRKLALPAPPPPLHPSGFAPPRMASPPPVTFHGPGGKPLPIGINISSSDGPSPLVSHTAFPSSQITNGAIVVVARTFAPSLPDELAVQTGEQLRVVNRYDDGWAHVQRLKSGGHDENGVVPLECLEAISPGSAGSSPIDIQPPAIPGSVLTQEAVEGWRLSKRKSSLHPTGSAHY